MLLAVPFDLGARRVTGGPVPLVEGVRDAGAITGATQFGVAGNGSLVYVPGISGEQRTMVWVDRQGREEPLRAPPRAYVYARLSPDGTRLAVEVGDQEWDIWMWDLTQETLTRFTFDPGLDEYPVWTPDGRRVVFMSQRTGSYNLFRQAADGTGAVERLTESPNPQNPYVFTPDGIRLVFREDTTSGQDLMLLTLEGERRVQPLLQTTFNELNGEISPDGRWLAYQSNEGGRDEIYVRPFPDVNGGRWQISTGGGTRPLWARAGHELFYLTLGGAVMSVPVEGGGSTFRAGNPTRLFEWQYYPSGFGRMYDASADGRRFLMIKGAAGAEDAEARTIVVVQNWVEELKRLVPGN